MLRPPPLLCFTAEMNTACLSPLIKAQPKPFVDAKGVNQGYVIVYKDEGGKHTYHHTMQVSLPPATHTVSIAAYAHCTDPTCSQHCDALPPPKFVSDQLFDVRECARDGFKGPLPRASVPVYAWREKANVSSYKTSMDDSLVIKCNFLKVTSKCMCNTCGGETQFKIVVATDNNCVDTSLPICVMSKRKIPASMRKKSQKEIKAFMDKARNKKAVQVHKRKGAAAVCPIQNKMSKPTRSAKRKCLPSASNSDIHAMTFEERTQFIKKQNASIKEMSSKINGLKAELAKKEHLLAAFQQQKASKRQKLSAITDSEMCITPRTNYPHVYATPPTFSWLLNGDRVPVEPFPLNDNERVGDFPEIEELDFDNWDLP